MDAQAWIARPPSAGSGNIPTLIQFTYHSLLILSSVSEPRGTCVYRSQPSPESPPKLPHVAITALFSSQHAFSFSRWSFVSVLHLEPNSANQNQPSHHYSPSAILSFDNFTSPDSGNTSMCPQLNAHSLIIGSTFTVSKTPAIICPVFSYQPQGTSEQHFNIPASFTCLQMPLPGSPFPQQHQL